MEIGILGVFAKNHLKGKHDEGFLKERDPFCVIFILIPIPLERKPKLIGSPRRRPLISIEYKKIRVRKYVVCRKGVIADGTYMGLTLLRQ